MHDRELTLDELDRMRQIPIQESHPYVGRRIRVVRTLVYEGEGLAVGQQLGTSLPPGGRRVFGKGALTIDVYQHEIEDLGPYEAPSGVQPLDALGEAEALAVLEHAAPESPVTARLRARAAARKAGV